MKKCVGILVNDLHIDKDNSGLVRYIFSQLINLCTDYDTNRIFVGGDVFTNRSGQPLSCLMDWREMLNLVEQAEMEIHVIPGNHDKTDSDDEKSYLDVYSERCCHIYRSGERRLFDGIVIAFIPYFKDEKWLEEYKKVLDDIEGNLIDGDIDETWPKILITHTGFDGVVNNDGTKVNSIIKPSMFKNWDKVLIGHYHNASKLADNVIYTGSAYQNDYGENITDKGFTAIFSDGTTKFIPSKFPKYIKEIIDVNDKETLMNLLDKYGDSEREDFVRFVFRGKKSDAHKVNISEIQNKYGIDCKFQSDEENEVIEISESEEVLSYDSKTLRQDFIRFCSDNGIKGEKFKYGLELLKQVKYVES